MTKKLFWDDPYQTTCDTVVTEVLNNKITVEETIFFAFSGGQESDEGTLGGYQVIEAIKEGKEIKYILLDEHDLKIGDCVTIKINWQRRYRLMRLHFAAEIILELIYQNYEDVVKIGAHIAEDKARIDFLWDGNISVIFENIEHKANEIIRQNKTIISEFTNQKEERRYWEIKDFAKVSCGGTHLKKTGEIGDIRLKRVNLGSGKERIEIYLKN